MRDLALRERLGDHADHLAARGERGIGDGAHHSDASAAEDDDEAGIGERAPDGNGRAEVRRITTGLRTAEDAHALELRCHRQKPPHASQRST